MGAAADVGFGRPSRAMSPVFKVSRGQVLDGRFHVLEEIGRGGMSVVFRAADLADEGRAVAVKVALPQYSSGVGTWSMFQQEGQIGAKLNHPGIVRFIGVPGKDRPYVVTEFVSGRTLASLVGKGRRLPERDALRTVSRVCDAVGYLHGQGFVHYDVKPGNVILGEDGSLRLIDLGMAHEVARGRFSFLVAAPAIATSEYAAPEQIGRRRGQTSVDIYALGAMLYELLTGHPPFEGDDPFVVASARQIGDPVAPRELCPDVSEAAEEIVLRALRRKPAERYLTVAALAADLDNPDQVRVSGLANRLIRVTPIRRRVRLMRFVALTGLLPIGVLLGLFVVLWRFLGQRH